jgi:hypothetical protein
VAIIVEFVGGFRDGGRFSSKSKDLDEAWFAKAMYIRSNAGDIGHTHRTASDAGMQIFLTEGPEVAIQLRVAPNHLYKVVSKTEKDGNITVRFEYAGQES